MINLKNTGKRILISSYRNLTRLFAWADHKYLDKNVPLSELVSHSKYLDYLTEIGNKKGIKVLEIGSREVTGESDAKTRFSNTEYIGFDYHPGPNVDVVGDAHKLSEYFKDEKFDIIYSSAVFEHFAMPWLVSTEISKLLKVGGIVFVETHFSFSSHERPWHFSSLVIWHLEYYSRQHWGLSV